MKVQHIIILFAIVAFSGVGCKKLGCKDQKSINFDSSATKDDGSCVYVSKLTIWFDSSQSATLQSNNVSELRYFLGGVYIGTVFSSEYSLNTPNCGDTLTFTRDITLGKVQTKTYTLLVRDQNDNYLQTTSFDLEGNSCYLYKL